MKALHVTPRLLAAGLLFSWALPTPSALAAPFGPLLETTNDACWGHLAWRDVSGHWVDIPSGQSRTVSVANGELAWTCDRTKERTGCPGATRTVVVTRSPGSGFTVQCFGAPRSDGARVLEQTVERCRNDRLTIVGAHGGVIIHYTHSGTVDVASGDVTWYCGEARERTGCPHGTNAVEVERFADGQFNVACLRK